MPKLTGLPFQAAAKIQQSVGKYLDRGSAELHYAYKMFEAGAFKLEPPQNVAAMVADIRRWGEFGMIPALNARRNPGRTAVIDDDGEMTFAELDDAAHSVANGLLAMGVRGGDGVAILARNHRWFLVAVYGVARTGARIILLNSEFSGPQIKEVSEREGAKVIIYDDEHAEHVGLVLAGVDGAVQLDQPVGAGAKRRVVAGRDRVEAERERPVQHGGELDLLVAAQTGVGGAPLGVLRHEVLDHVLVEAVGEVPDVERDADHVGGTAGVVGVLDRAAPAGTGAVGGRIARERQVDAGDVVAGLLGAGGGDGGVHSPGHGGDDSHPGSHQRCNPAARPRSTAGPMAATSRSTSSAVVVCPSEKRSEERACSSDWPMARST